MLVTPALDYSRAETVVGRRRDFIIFETLYAVVSVFAEKRAILLRN